MLKRKPLILVFGGFLAQLLTILSLGLLGGPVLGSYQLMMILYLRDNKQPEFNDILLGFQRFVALFPFFFLTLIIFIGFAFIIPGFLFATWWIYTLPLMVHRKMDFWSAMRASYNKVTEKGFFMHLVFLFMITAIPIMILNLLSTVIPFLSVLQILLPSIQTGCLAGLYLEHFEGIAPALGPGQDDSSSGSASMPRTRFPADEEEQTRPLPEE